MNNKNFDEYQKTEETEENKSKQCENEKDLKNENENENNENNSEKEQKKSTKEESIEDKFAKITTDLEDWKNAYMRKNAEFQNFTKRKQNEAIQLRKYASEKVILKVLESVDNLERAVAASLEMKDFDSLIKGVEMTLSQMHSIMNSEGVEPIVSKGKKFDPHLHQAVLTENSETVENDHIIMELQKGYKMKDKVIRPSMVKVCKK